MVVIYVKEAVFSGRAPKPVGPYSQAVKAGKFVFVSGQLPIDQKEGKIVAAGVALQTRQVMENIRAVLEAAGCGLRDVVQCSVFLSSMTSFDEFNDEYARFFDGEFPARTTVGAELKAGVLIEVSVAAYKD
jgi:2-iminobutanoate/2-iminopropanoate deaminase